MIRLDSLRLKVAVGFALFCVLVVAAHSLGMFVVTEDQEEQLIDQLVAEEMEHLLKEYRAGGETVLPRSQNMQAYVARNEAERQALPPELRGLTVGIHEVFGANGEQHLEVRREGDATFYMVYDVDYHEQRLRQFAWILALGIAGVAVVTLWLGYWVSGLLVRQVEDLAQRVENLDPRGPAEPLAARYHDREVAALARAFEGYQRRMDQLIRREQEFTANASHELRTPLTAIRTGCELVLQERDLSAKARQRMEKILAAADRIAQLTDTLLQLARRQASGEIGEVPLRECVEDALEPYRDMAAAKGLEVTVAVAEEVTVNADREALQVVLGNLIRNAVTYTRSGFVAVHGGPDRVEVADSGPGIPADDLPEIFHRFRRGSGQPSGEGSGLGLAIAEGLCRQSGWRLSVASTLGRGSVFTVEFASQ